MEVVQIYISMASILGDSPCYLLCLFLFVFYLSPIDHLPNILVSLHLIHWFVAIPRFYGWNELLFPPQFATMERGLINIQHLLRFVE